MRKFMVLLKKELRELLTLQMILPMVMVVVVFHFLGTVMKNEAGEREKLEKLASPLALCDMDGTDLSGQCLAAFKDSFEVSLFHSLDPATVFASLPTDGRHDIFLVIPAGFEAEFLAGRKCPVQLHTRVRNFSLSDSGRFSRGYESTRILENFLSREHLSRAGTALSQRLVMNPLKVQEFTIVGEKSAAVSPVDLFQFFMKQNGLIPMVLFLVIVMAAQMLSGAIAAEKEDKTLETLLSTPVNRQSIVLAKMLAAAIVSLMMVAMFIAGFHNYMSGITSDVNGDVELSGNTAIAVMEIGVSLGASDFLLLGLIVFLGILCALSLTVILSVFAENTKTVNGLITPLMALIMLPYMLVMFVEVEKASPILKTIIYGNPFSYPFLGLPAMIFGQKRVLVFGAVYMVLFFGLMVAAAAKIFSSDLVVTARLGFFSGRRKDGN
ncbi:MAG: ABC transporter permease [Candidatus Wallbacteria bacterium]|nr:ABC transporter permease [Candidatus Wallbacteria bacterium]